MPMVLAVSTMLLYDYIHGRNQHVYHSEDNRPEFIPFTVPRLGSEYDFAGFWDYPARMGWRVHRHDRYCHGGYCPPGLCSIEIGEGIPSPYGLNTPSISRADSDASISAKLAFLQSWLFFGAMAEVHTLCHLSINPTDYSGNVFNTSRLNGLPRRLFHASQNSGNAGSKILKEKLYAIIRHIQLMITRSSDWEDEHDYTLTQCEVFFSICLLLRTFSLALLCHSRQSILSPEDNLKISIADPVNDWRPEGQMSMMKFTCERLLRNGWCKSEMWHILQSFDVSTAACYLQRPHAIQGHDKCTDTTCMAYQIDETHYRTLHATDSCECTFVFVDPAKLRDALARNVIPAITVSEDLQVSVVDGKEFTYIAFSHVWADGLGNPFHNALPRCQLRILRDLSIQLCNKFGLGARGTPIAFWIDTLCIPVAPELREYRKLAIRLLAYTYTKAMAVLVLDRELRHFESSTAPILELCIRLMCSGWLKRLWTLQEASLAGGVGEVGTLYIQMADGPARWNRLKRFFEYKPSRIKPSPRKPSALAVTVQEAKTDLVYGMHLLTAVEDRLPSVHEIQHPLFESRLQKITRAVQNRSTSKREDEAICMASLVGLDLAEILDAKEADERMINFYRQLYEIPTAILFADFGEPNFLCKNFTSVPYRWAPKSLLSVDRPMEISLAFYAMSYADPPLPLYGSCEDDGLHIKHPGFTFVETQPVVIMRETRLLDTNSGELYSLSLALSDSSPDTIGPVGRCALIFKTDIYSGVLIVAIKSDVADESGTTLFVTIIGHGTVKPGSGAPKSDVTPEILPFRGVFTKRDQPWCVT